MARVVLWLGGLDTMRSTPLAFLVLTVTLAGIMILSPECRLDLDPSHEAPVARAQEVARGGGSSSDPPPALAGPLPLAAASSPAELEAGGASNSGSEPRERWCEAIVPARCESTRDCDLAPDGSAQRCVKAWWSDGAKVCAPRFPSAPERAWRRARLRVYVGHVCRKKDGCDPRRLDRYLRLLAGRESTWRPYKRHRLNPDLVASRSAWRRVRDRYIGNPHYDDPGRWSAGTGLYGQIPALWVWRWDPRAPPEVLCGEVEASEAHLRGVRAAVKKLRKGIDCDGDARSDYWGSGHATCERPCEAGDRCEPSWYDVARVNSGSICPGSDASREKFEVRARKLGLCPYAAVPPGGLGRSIPAAQQDEVARDLRERMDAIEREGPPVDPRGVG